MNIENVKGFKDSTGEEAKKRAEIKSVLAYIFKLYGFEPAETPIVEYEEFVKGDNQNDEAISDIFKLQDKGKRALALRYEFTFQLKRIAQNKKLPYKRYQIGEVFRDEPISSNRFRQFTQCDADIVGSTIKDEAEVLAMVNRVLTGFSIKATINVNNRKLLNEILDGEKINEKEAVMKEIDKMDKLDEKQIKENLKKYGGEKLITILNKPEAFFKKYKSYKEIEELKKYCKEYGVKINFKPSLARGLSYYTGTVVEVKSAEMKETITAGGAYIVNNIQSFGLAFGLERITQLAKVDLLSKSAVIISIGKDKEAIKLSEDLRSEGISCSVTFGKISKALDYANANGIPYVIFFGEEEAKKKKVKIRNMKSGKEEMVLIKDISKKLK